MTDASEAPRLELLEELGRGATSRVELARLKAPFGDLPEGAAVAVKTLAPELGDDPRAVAALEAEAESGRALDHPSLARVLHHGLGPEGPYLVQQYVPGRSRRFWPSANGCLTRPTVRWPRTSGGSRDYAKVMIAPTGGVSTR